MTACEICSGRHETAHCVTGQWYIRQCFAPRVDHYRPPLNVISLDAARERRSSVSAEEASGKRASRHLARARRMRA